MHLRQLNASLLPLLFAVPALAETQEQQLIPLFQQPFAAAGSSVAVHQTSNDNPEYPPPPAALWAGAPFATAGARGSGLVHAWSFSALQGGTWSYAFSLSSSSPQPGALFGSSVAVTPTATGGSYVFLMVGSPGHRNSVANSSASARRFGMAEVFTVSVQNPTNSVSQMLTPSELAADDAFGSSVALSSTLPSANPSYFALASAPGRDIDGIADAGAVTMFRRTGGNPFTLFATLALPEPAPYDRLGRAALASTGTACFASMDRGDGGVAIFDITGATSFTSILPPPDAQSHGFGAALSADGELLVVGAPGAYGKPADTGVVHIFRASAPYDLLLTIPSPWPQECAGFGSAVSLERHVLVVSTAQGSESLASGSVAIYSVLANGAAATLIGTLAQPGENGFGAAVATSGGHVAVGVPGGSAQVAGAVTVLDEVRTKSPDLNHDGIVNGADLGMLIAKFTSGLVEIPEDLNSDLQVNGADLAILLGAWGTSG
ncbi:MAG: hypothetical protein U0625_12925 [Phycisphaerales bacterium]